MKTQQPSIINKLAASAVIFFFFPSCDQTPKDINYLYQEAAYETFRLSLGDTISFPLGEHHYNNIASSNYFISNNIPYISFFDKGSKSLLVYEFNSQKLTKSEPLVKWVRQTKLDKASVYMINFDSIIVATQLNLFLIDSSGFQHRKIDFFDSKEKKGTINNNEPAVIKGNFLYIGVKPYVDEKSLSAHKKWRALYRIDLETGYKEMVYPLPELYHKNLYGYPFMDYGYCINNKGNFVFSFAADQNIYETDIDSFENSYNAQSRFHKGAIPPMTRKEIESTGTYKIYAMRDSYGPIIYDPNNKLYFRQAKQGTTPELVAEKNYSKQRSIIILNQEFKIIGEVLYDDNFSFTSMFFTENGKSFVRVNHKDETAIHFVEFTFNRKEEVAKNVAY